MACFLVPMGEAVVATAFSPKRKVKGWQQVPLAG